MSHHTCKDLGVCKCPVPECQDNTARPLRFAPGVVEGYRAPALGTPAQRRELVCAFKLGVLAMAAVGLVALAAGWVVGRLL